MRTLWDDGIAKAAAGLTSIEELDPRRLDVEACRSTALAGTGQSAGVCPRLPRRRRAAIEGRTRESVAVAPVLQRRLRSATDATGSVPLRHTRTAGAGRARPRRLDDGVRRQAAGLAGRSTAPGRGRADGVDVTSPGLSQPQPSTRQRALRRTVRQATARHGRRGHATDAFGARRPRAAARDEPRPDRVNRRASLAATSVGQRVARERRRTTPRYDDEQFRYSSERAAPRPRSGSPGRRAEGEGAAPGPRRASRRPDRRPPRPSRHRRPALHPTEPDDGAPVRRSACEKSVAQLFGLSGLAACRRRRSAPPGRRSRRRRSPRSASRRSRGGGRRGRRASRRPEELLDRVRLAARRRG